MVGVPLSHDPYNIIITGVGGQGNVMASRVLANMLVKRGYYVTIGETFGASQRGGSVMSHLRVSERSSWSPQIPEGRAHMVVALEPVEGIRVLKAYGNPQVQIVSNTRAIHPVGVIAGELDYPSVEAMRTATHKLAARAWFVDATGEAVQLGNPILGNIIMLGALVGVRVLPLHRKDFEEVIVNSVPRNKLEINLKAYDIGEQIVKQQEDR